MLDEASVGALQSSFSGPILRPADASYDDARQVFNGLIDKRPALIARARSAPDVAVAIGFARQAGLELSVRGGGHSIAGRSVTEGGLMIDLSAMKSIEIDAAAHTARAEPGVTWGELNDAAATHGLATTGGVVSTTGIAGLTLGGGLGYLMNKHGMAADNLLSAEVVTAAGDVVTASAEDDPDLFWAIRGAGANFGVTTSFEYRLHEVRQIVGGVIAHPFDDARDFLRFLREFNDGLPDEVYTFGGLAHAPDGSGVPIAVVAVGHCGDEAAAETDLKPLLEFGSPMLSQVGPMPYPAINTIFDAAYPKGSLNYWKSSFIRDLDDGTIDTMIEAFDQCPSPTTSIGLEHFHGTATRVGVTDTAVPHREPGHNLLLTSVWTDPAESERNIAWSRDTYAALEPSFAGRRYLNYLSEDDAGAAGRVIYGPNFDRLVELKTKYDPDNVFHLNQNISPAGA